MFNFFNRNGRHGNTGRVHADEGENWMALNFRFHNQPLPYAYDALEPFIDEKTMRLHHDRHLGDYIEKLNTAIEPYELLHNMTLETLILSAPSLDEPLRTEILRNAGGVFNHFFFFEGMTPNAEQPDGAVLDFIRTYYGTLETFKTSFTNAAMSVFGSGYAWLVLNDKSELKIITTANQSTPLSINLKPLLCIDVWEHAYYLKHYNERRAYIMDWFNVVDWKMVLKHLTNFTSNSPQR